MYDVDVEKAILSQFMLSLMVSSRFSLLMTRFSFQESHLYNI